MAETNDSKKQATRGELLEGYSREKRAGLVAEYWGFLVHRKKWYLMPIVGLLILLGALVLLGGTGAAPFLYTLF